MKKTALIVGATGLVGKQCLAELLSCGYYDKVVALTRKPLSLTHPIYQNQVVDFDSIPELTKLVKATDIFCCTGTTIAKAGSQQAFRKVDFDLPLNVAKAAIANSASQFLLISSLGADAYSSVFYSRVKGELEHALEQLHFKQLIIFRPSILLGERPEKRMGEAVGQWVAQNMPFIFSGPLKKYRGTPADKLAKAMIAYAQKNLSGTHIIENDEILDSVDKKL